MAKKTRQTPTAQTPGVIWIAMAICLALAGGWKPVEQIRGWWSPAPIVDPAPGPKPAPVVDAEATEAAHTAALAYFHALGKVYAHMAENPPKTTRDAAEEAQRVDFAAAKELAGAINRVLAPRIGAEELDPNKAKATFSAVAEGFKRVK